jgi:Flp pilus assembly protein TadD
MQAVGKKKQQAARVTAEIVSLMREDPARALSAARRALKAHPGHAPLWHAAGLSALRTGNMTDSARDLKRASQIAQDDPAIWTDLCNALRQSGATHDAVKAGMRAVDLDPGLAAAHNNLGAALRQAGRLDDAEASLRRAIAVAPESPDTHNNLGNVLKAGMRYAEAVVHYQEALRHRPNYPEALANLGATYVEMGDWAKAETTCRDAVAIAPQLPEAYRNLGSALYWQGKLDESVTTLRTSLALDPADPIARKQLALALIELDQLKDAANVLVDGLALDRPPPGTKSDAPHVVCVTPTKLRHDLEQILLLAVEPGAPQHLKDVAEDVQATADRIGNNDNEELIDLREVGRGKTATYVNRVIHIEDVGPLAGSTLNADLDTKKITADFGGSTAGYVIVDSMLRPEALEGLRRFCERSTIWFQSNFAGEIGTSMVNGFASPLVFQIARDLKRAFPSIFGPHMFQACWSYRYYADQSGLDLHTDAATVSMNIWITPDEANLNPATGGLVFWNRRGPKDFFTKPMAEKSAILDTIAAAPDARAEVVPYRCNRALLFGAGIVHKTDAFSFKSGYHDRRMNVTFLFGPPA